MKNATVARMIVEARHPDQIVGTPTFNPSAGGFYVVDTSGGQELVSLDTIRCRRQSSEGVL